jgi:hypothetical protein
MGASFNVKTYDRDERLGSPVSDSSINSTEPLPLQKAGANLQVDNRRAFFYAIRHKVDLPFIGKSFLGIPSESID